MCSFFPNLHSRTRCWVPKSASCLHNIQKAQIYFRFVLSIVGAINHVLARFNTKQSVTPRTDRITQVSHKRTQVSTRNSTRSVPFSFARHVRTTSYEHVHEERYICCQILRDNGTAEKISNVHITYVSGSVDKGKEAFRQPTRSTSGTRGYFPFRPDDAHVEYRSGPQVVLQSHLPLAEHRL